MGEEGSAELMKSDGWSAGDATGLGTDTGGGRAADRACSGAGPLPRLAAGAEGTPVRGRREAAGAPDERLPLWELALLLCVLAEGSWRALFLLDACLELSRALVLVLCLVL